MNAKTDPLQQVVTAGNCASGSGQPGLQRAVTAETPDARLRRVVYDMVAEVRTERARVRRGKRYRESLSFYDGEKFALERLLEKMRKEPPASGVGGNGKLSEPAGGEDSGC